MDRSDESTYSTRRRAPKLAILLAGSAVVWAACSSASSPATEGGPCTQAGERGCASDGMSVLECQTPPSDASVWVLVETCANGQRCESGTCAGDCPDGACGTGDLHVEPPFVRGAVGSCFDFRLEGDLSSVDGVWAWGVRDGSGKVGTVPAGGPDDADHDPRTVHVCFRHAGRNGVTAQGASADAWIWDATIVARATVGVNGGFVNAVAAPETTGHAGAGTAPAQSNGLSLLVPPDAVGEGTDVRVLEVTGWHRQPVSHAAATRATWQLEPSGLVPDRPVLARLPVSRLFGGMDCEEVPARVRVVLSSDEGTRQVLEPLAFDCATGFLEVAVPHFSTLSVEDAACLVDATSDQYDWAAGSVDFDLSELELCNLEARGDSSSAQVLRKAKRLSEDIEAHLNVLFALGDELDGESLRQALDVRLETLDGDIESGLPVWVVAKHVGRNYLAWLALQGRGVYADLDVFDRYGAAIGILGLPSAADVAADVLSLTQSDLAALAGLVPGGQAIQGVLKMTEPYVDALALAIGLVERMGWHDQLDAYFRCRGELGRIPTPATGSLPEVPRVDICADGGGLCTVSRNSGFFCTAGAGQTRPFFGGHDFLDEDVVALAELLYQISKKDEPTVTAELEAVHRLLDVAAEVSLLGRVLSYSCGYLADHRVLCETDAGAEGIGRCDAASAAFCDGYPRVTVDAAPFGSGPNETFELTVQARDDVALANLVVDFGDGQRARVPIEPGSRAFDWETPYAWGVPGNHEVTATVTDEAGSAVSRRVTVDQSAGRVCDEEADCPAGSRCDCDSQRCVLAAGSGGSGGLCRGSDDCHSDADCRTTGVVCRAGSCRQEIPVSAGCEAREPGYEICNNGLDDDCDGVADERSCDVPCDSHDDCPRDELVCHCGSGVCMWPQVAAYLGGGCDEQLIDRWPACFDRGCGEDAYGNSCGVCRGDAVCTARGRCDSPPVAVLRFERTTAEIDPGGFAAFYYDVSGSYDPDGDPLRVVEFLSNGTSIGPQTSGRLELGPGGHHIELRVTDGQRSALSEPVLLTVSERNCRDACVRQVCGWGDCGVSCGSCPEGEYCYAGGCLPSECGDFTYEGCCEGKNVKYCRIKREVSTSYCRESCGWNDEDQRYRCGYDGEDPSGQHPRDCPVCTPACGGKECGPDGCGGQCEPGCPTGAGGPYQCRQGRCVDLSCIPDCNGKACGDDGCGGLCGSCAAGQPCSGGQCGAVAAGRGIALGRHFACRLLESRSVECWGENDEWEVGPPSLGVSTGTPTPVEGLTDITSIDLGGHTGCAVDTSGDVYCWGYNGDDHAIVPNATSELLVPTQVAAVSEILAVAVSGAHVCALTERHKVVCWGWNGEGQCGSADAVDQPIPPNEVDGLSGVIKVVVGGSHSCALLDDGTVACWGDNGVGQLGIGTMGGAYPVPSVVSGLSDIVDVSASFDSTCSLTASGEVYCWGDNGEGQLGVDPSVAEDVLRPTRVLGLTDAIGVSVGWFVGCAVHRDGRVSCWGNNFSGALGRGTMDDGIHPSPALVQQLANVVQVAAGSASVCALLVDGTARCWGDNDYGQLGAGAVDDGIVPTPTRAFEGHELSEVEAGNRNTCGITVGGRLVCCGENDDAQLGTGVADSDPHPVPSVVPGVLDVAASAVCHSGTCAIKSDGSLACWGEEGQDSPGSVSGVGPFRDVGVGNTTCTVGQNGVVECWGSNFFGGLGVGRRDTGDHLVPAAVPDLPTIRSIRIRKYQVSALDIAGRLWDWGENWRGDTHVGNVVLEGDAFLAPREHEGLPAVERFDIGEGHGCAIDGDSAVVCWGSARYGAVGVAPDASEVFPFVRVPGMQPASAIAAGDYHTCAVVSGRAYCWGSNDSGQLGIGVVDEEVHWTPTLVPGLSGIVSLSAGNDHSCALDGDGAAWCWGLNSAGQLGLGWMEERDHSLPELVR